MKKVLVVFAALLFTVAIVAPVFAQAQAPAGAPAVKGTEGPDVRKVEPKGTEGPDVKKAKKKTASSAAPKAKGTEGPDVRKVEPKGTEGPDVKKK
jgi:hypothetical protein